jgi:hypothetical protein
VFMVWLVITISTRLARVVAFEKDEWAVKPLAASLAGQMAWRCAKICK